MALETLTTPRSNLPNVYTGFSPRAIAFSLSFEENLDGIRNMMRVTRPIRKQNGTELVSYNVSVELTDGDVPAGAVIEYSKSTATAVKHDNIRIKKFACGVPIEEIYEYGADIAIERKDKAFIRKLVNNIMGDFYTELRGGTLTQTVSGTWQKALAMAKGLVVDKFNKLQETPTEIIGYANVLDFYDYLGGADITTQTQFGIQYIKDFLGYTTLFLLSDPDIPRGTVIATPSQNIVMYYIDPTDADVRKADFNMVTAGEGNLIGIIPNGNTSTLVSEITAVYGVKFWAQYQDGIAVITMGNASPAAETKSATKK